ncbi:sodium-dependent transporter [Fenollaria sporofastidiosus]|uniref:sodium-dependent transporter n=1 Tax=Fenollaria sporofastidiosus TaxID=2811778 RepID=UPI001C00484E|nr:sodium-dependent transporter [Fenollaria sporofastidiosus]
MSDKSRGTWNSRFGYIMAAAGFSIGLGNVWRFPYLVGTNGGGAFVLVYLLICVFIGIPLFYMEVALGRKAQASPILGMRKLTKKGSPWTSFGWLGVLSAFFILTYYIQIMGWILNYLIKMATGEMAGFATEQYAETFAKMIDSPATLVIFTLVCTVIIGIISAQNLNDGLEKACKFMMPALFIMLVLVVVRSVTLPNAMEGVKWYMNVDFSKINSESILAALGQCFFSVGIASGGAFVYGSYLNKDSDIPTDGLMVIGFDTLAALIAGFAIFPAVFALNLPADSGSNLLFITMSNVFMHLPFGRFFGVLFFLLMFFAALSSALGYLEPVSSSFSELLKISRKKGVVYALASIFIVGLLTIFGQNILKDVTILGRNMFDFADFLSGNILMPLGAIALILYTLFKWKFDVFREDVNTGANSLKVPKVLKYVSYVLPFVLIVIFVRGLGIF